MLCLTKKITVVDVAAVAAPKFRKLIMYPVAGYVCKINAPYWGHLQYNFDLNKLSIHFQSYKHAKFI